MSTCSKNISGILKSMKHLNIFSSSVPVIYERRDQKLKRLLEVIDRQNDTIYMISFSKVSITFFILVHLYGLFSYRSSLVMAREVINLLGLKNHNDLGKNLM